MHLTYVDECGDAGLVDSPTHYFHLAALIVPEESWQECFCEVKALRKDLRMRYGIPIKEELHGSDLVNGNGASYRHSLTAAQVGEIIGRSLTCVSRMPGARIFGVTIRKDQISRRDTFKTLEFAWSLLATRLHYIMGRQAEMMENDRRTILIPDNTQNDTIRRLLRRLRVFNPVPVGGRRKNVPLLSITEDPLFVESKHSPFVQLADLIAYVSVAKNVRIRKFEPYDFQSKYRILTPVLERRVSRDNDEAIVYFPKTRSPAEAGPNT